MKKLWSILLALTLLFTFCFPSLVLASTSYTRIADQDRYETSAQIATSGWTQSDYAVLCYGENYPDALSSAPLAKKYNAPILLTTSNSLPDSTKQALTTLQVKTVIIVGGTGVISSNIDLQLQSMGISVSRVFGDDKYGTAIAVAEQVTTTPSSIFVCNGDDFGDALSVAPIASIQQSPIILVSSDSIPDSVKNYIASNKISKTYAIGYSDIISDSIVNQFPNPERITGSDKYSRNVNINKYFNNTFASSGCGIATGEGFADALSSTAYLAKIDEPLVLVNFNSPNDTRSYYQQRMGDESKVTVFGGSTVVPDSVISGLSTLNSDDNGNGNSSTPSNGSSNNSGNITINNNSNNTTVNNNSNNNNTINNNTTIINNGTTSVDTSHGSIKGVITWQYNKLIGTKADVGAKIALIPVNHDKTLDESVFTITLQQDIQGKNGIYTTKADGYGNYEIDNVKNGDYYLLISSENTNSDITIDSNNQEILTNLFSDSDWSSLQLILKMNKYKLIKVEIEGGKTITESYDFGNTYF